ncbi:MAG: porin [Sphingomonadales bacterium]|nr:porin [Sphingomonadales bacterium]
MNALLKKTAITALLASTASLIALPAHAEDASISSLQEQINALQAQINKMKVSAEKNDIKVKWEPAPSIKSPDGNFEMNMRGRMYIDGGWVNDSDDTMNVKATEFRTARIGIEGKAFKNVKYKFEADLAGNEVDMKDAYLQIKSSAGKYTIGQFKTPNSLAEQTSSRYITFMERPSFTDAFSFARQLGVGAGFGGSNWTMNAGVFRGSNGADNEDEGTTFAARATYSPEIAGGALHLGASTRFRDQGDDMDLLRYRQRPHAHLSDRFVATSKFANSDSFYGLEAAYVAGPFSIESEWGVVKADIEAPEVGQADPSFNGGYVDASYFINGHRKYDAKKGTFGRPSVKPGAIQIGARYDYLDLNDEGYFGGKQSTYVVGVNYYLNKYARLMVNYSHSNVKDAFDVSANGLDGANKINALGIRAQIDW